MAIDKKVTGYSTAQVALHWAVVVLVAFQFVAHDAIESAWRAFLRSDGVPADTAALTYLHIAIGALILLLVLVRIFLRIKRGAPPPPADEPRILKIIAEAVHGLIYVLLLVLPISGIVAWFAGVAAAGGVHSLLTNLLLAAIALHVLGGLFQHFVRRSDVMMRMFRPQQS